jgi:hypothetical protein
MKLEAIRDNNMAIARLRYILGINEEKESLP